jgi:hypothetical protein
MLEGTEKCFLQSFNNNQGTKKFPKTTCKKTLSINKSEKLEKEGEREK